MHPLFVFGFLGAIAVFLGFEFVGVFIRKKPGDTFTELVWSVIRRSRTIWTISLILFVALAVWLVGHFWFGIWA